MDYWEEVTAEDGSSYFFDHTSQEYYSSLPTNDATTSIVESAVEYGTTDDAEPRSATAAWESGNESDLEKRGEQQQQVWDGVDGELFVPWPEEEPDEAMKASPEAAGSNDEFPEKPEGDIYIRSTERRPAARN